MYNISGIVHILQPTDSRLACPDLPVQTICYDSRKITNPGRALFFALSGRKDGHTYLYEAYRSGVRNFVVKPGRAAVRDFQDANFIFVHEPLAALQQLAAFHRSRFSYPVIAITGSNGKTIVKEWLWHLLSPEYKIVRSPKSYNSQLGVPLSLWQMDEQHNLAIIEAGISKPGEMALLEKMIKPTLGVFTNLGPAHEEGFLSPEEKLREKLQLFASAETWIYPLQYLKHAGLQIQALQQLSWGADPQADLQITSSEILSGRQRLMKGVYKGQNQQVLIPFTDAASAENAVCCWAVMLALGYDQQVIGERLATLQPLSMRLELKSGLRNCSVIDDSYSNDIASLSIALDFLNQQQQHPERILILSDLPETAGEISALYQEVALLVKDKAVNRLIGVGPDISAHAALFAADALFFARTEELIEALPALAFTDATILLKGARKFTFEEISRRLTAKLHETSLEINLNALEHNLNSFRGLLQPETKLMAMVKAFSYGSGSYEIANLLQFNQVDYLTVAYADEGAALRRAGIDLPIVVMSPESSSFSNLLTHKLEPEVYSFHQLQSLLDFLRQTGQSAYGIHLKLNTGMNRLGFEPTDLEALLPLLKQDKLLLVKSVFSHLAAAGDEQHDDFTRRQLDAFEYFTKQLAAGLGYQFIRHIANTAAITRWPQARYDMVRLGIGLHGIAGSEENQLHLETVATLKTTVAQVRLVKAGESIGYNRHGRLQTDGKIATVKIGYADGYNRRFGNGAAVMYINGQAAPTVGDICMDMCMLDVTGIDDVAEGDDVIVFGREPTAVSLSRAIGTIPYELLATISQRVKRIYFYE